MLQRTPLTEPKQVAWLLASYAREARARAEDHPLASFNTVKTSLQEALGIQFEGEKGEHFFRSTLVQTLFYGIFSAWVLWRHSPQGRAPNARFNWRLSDDFLKVPILRKLFREVSDRAPLNAIQLTEVLELAGDALNRVQPTLFDIFRGEEAVAYFYEPFLEAFDPELRKELGVWYTPREIVHYMVERVDHLLRTELNQPLGLASKSVRILDPCCGTGAYLTTVLNRIHRTLLENAGDDPAYVASDLREAALTRVFGFEIMPAPFVIAHMEITRLLEDAGAALSDTQRAGVFLTNSLTGWVPLERPKAIFAEMEQERQASDDIKQHGTILVILGNPPYNGYAGIAKIEEERDLTTAYRAPIAGLPAPQGQGLNDLYIRFFRIAERRIAGNANGQGIVSFISNNAWLDGLSHTTMRHLYLHTFQQIFIDNLNGDKYRTGKTTPDGKPDPSAFSTPQNREGIQVGTAISTLVRNITAVATPVDGATTPSAKGATTYQPGAKPQVPRPQGMQRAESPTHTTANDAVTIHLSAEGTTNTPSAEGTTNTPSAEGATTYQPGPKAQVTDPTRTQRAESPTHTTANGAVTVHLRDLWGATKLSHLERESRREAEPNYTTLTAAPALGNPFAHRIHSAAYTSWPRLPDLFPVSYPGIKTSRDPLLVDIDRERLEERMRFYLNSTKTDAEVAALIPSAMENSAHFNASQVRRSLEQKGFRPWQIIRYMYRPFDLRWLYWEPQTDLLDRKREDYVGQLFTTAWLEARQRESGEGFNRGTYVRTVADNFGNGLSNFFPMVIIDDRKLIPGLLPTDVNLSKSAEAYLGRINRKAQLSSEEGRELYNNEPQTLTFAASWLYPFFHAMTTMHTPQYRLENSGALLGDWPRIPLPATAELLAHSAALGRRLAELLDPESSLTLSGEWSFLGALKRPHHAIPEETLKITAGWGSRGQGSTVMPGRGRLAERPWTPDERKKLAILEASQSLTLEAAFTLLGETCVDVYLNAIPTGDQTGQSVFWSTIPINVWNYTLGGYQVLKKWLSYREFSLLGRPLHEDESKYFAQVARRIAAILLLGPALDASYQAIIPTATGLPAQRYPCPRATDPKTVVADKPPHSK